MAAQGKKGKTKWKSVSTEILISSSKSVNWADEVDRELDRDIPHTLDNKPTKVELPTAPRASRASAIDETKIPYTGPFQAYISNVPYDLNEEELTNFFQDLKIKNVRLPREERSGNRAKGFGYIEFEDRASLSAALSRGDTMLKGRSIHIELATNSDRQGGQRGRRDGGRDQNSSDRTTGNWRSGPRQDDNEERGGGFDRGGHGGRRDYGSGGGGGGSGYSRGGFDREERGFNRGGGGGFDREDRGGGGGGSFHRGEDRDNRGGGGGFDRYDRGGRDDRREGSDRHERDNRDRGFGGRDRDGGGFGYNDRGGGGGFRDKDRGFGRDEERGGAGAGAGAGGGSSSGHWRDEPRENRGFGNRGFDDRNRDRDRDSKFGPPRRDDTQLPERTSRATESGTRPKIVLQPRTKPIEPAASDGASSASTSIFGGAKPVDTAAREREIEERLMRSTEDFSEASYRGGKSGPGSTGSRGDKQQWTDEKRVEPAPPPKENAWARKPPATVVNNGRSTPEEERSQSQQSGNAQDSSDEPSSEPKRTEETRRGGGAVPSRSTSGTSDRSKGKDSDRQSSKHRERKEGGDDILKMPKMQASRPPNFAGSNKYSSLVDSDEAPNE